MTNPKPCLLVVDDEAATRNTLADILRLEGYQVETASGGDEAISLISQKGYDLILLDLKMPGTDGLDVLRYIGSLTPEFHSPEAADQLPPTVIMLTAHGSLESAIAALRHGAQDYLLKPSSTEQILGSISKGLRARARQIQARSLLRELPRTASDQEKEVNSSFSPPPVDIYTLPGEVTVNLARREIYCLAQVIKLTPTEGKLMRIFLQNPRQVFSHRELVLQVQGYNTTDWEAPEVLRPLVSRLRRKLAALPGGQSWIASIRGTGYVFEVFPVRTAPEINHVARSDL